MQKLVLTTPEELENLMRSIVKEELAKFLDQLMGQKDQLLSAADVAKLFKVSRVTIYKMKREGRLPYKYVNSRLRFVPTEVMEVLDSRR